MLKGICFIILMIISLNVLIKYMQVFCRWFLRIYIGKITDDNKWEAKVNCISRKWLIKTPKVKINEDSYLPLFNILRGQYYSDSVQYWQKAALLLGVCSNINNYKNNLQIIMNNIYDKNGNWIKFPKTIDCAMLSYAVISVNSSDFDSNQYKPSFDYCWKLIQDNIGEDGTIMYRKSMERYRYIDTIGFVCPFLIKYGIKYRKDKCIDLAINQIHKFVINGFDNMKVPYHAYDIKYGYKLGIGGWARGVGWLYMGVIDSYMELDKTSSSKLYLEKLVTQLSKFVIDKQSNCGGFGWNLLEEGTRIDSSATSIFAYCLKRASTVEEIKEECEKSSQKALNYLKSVTRRSGIIDFSQGDTKGIGIYSVNFDLMPFTQGITLRTFSLYK